MFTPYDLNAATASGGDSLGVSRPSVKTTTPATRWPCKSCNTDVSALTICVPLPSAFSRCTAESASSIASPELCVVAALLESPGPAIVAICFGPAAEIVHPQVVHRR